MAAVPPPGPSDPGELIALLPEDGSRSGITNDELGVVLEREAGEPK